jgi:hypothetical protein
MSSRRTALKSGGHVVCSETPEPANRQGLKSLKCALMILQAIVCNWIAHVSKSRHPGSDEYLVDLNLLRTFWDPISKYLYPVMARALVLWDPMATCAIAKRVGLLSPMLRSLVCKHSGRWQSYYEKTNSRGNICSCLISFYPRLYQSWVVCGSMRSSVQSLPVLFVQNICVYSKTCNPTALLCN